LKYIAEFSENKIIKKLINSIEKNFMLIGRRIKLMEVCGTHTMNIGRFGLRKLLPEGIELLSGPGCPVCVTPPEFITAAIELAGAKDLIITTFGDMIKVPNSKGQSLKNIPANKVKIVYSPEEALKFAAGDSSVNVVFLGVGFETTAPLVAQTIKKAALERINNFYCFSAHKLVPPALKQLCSVDNSIDGFLLPGHVSVVIGEKGYEGLGVRGAITGFEPADILYGINTLLKQIITGRHKVENCYKRAVQPSGNKIMTEVLNEVFEVQDTSWRGIGIIPSSGFFLKEKYKKFDAALKFNINIKLEKDNNACSCAEILQGKKKPFECVLFGKRCSPENPVGPCMVSSEGACSAYYKYER